MIMRNETLSYAGKLTNVVPGWDPIWRLYGGPWSWAIVWPNTGDHMRREIELCMQAN